MEELIQDVYLYNRDAKGKLNMVTMQAYRIDGIEEYKIVRTSGLMDGKRKISPILEITEGKAKRTVLQQVVLKFESLQNDFEKKGYKTLIDYVGVELADSVDPEDYVMINTLIPVGTKTDQTGDLLPMLAKDVISKENKEFFTKRSLCSRKYDGVRTICRMKDLKLVFKSRTGKEFGPAVDDFVSDPWLIKFVAAMNAPIDGEIYVHGRPLKDINGATNSKKRVPEKHDALTFCIFDVIMLDKTAEERTILIEQYVKANPLPKKSKLVIVKQYRTNNYKEARDLHDKFVGEGYEGAMIKFADGMYEPSKRSGQLWKLKNYMDEEFTILGIAHGLRIPDDMCFVCQTKEGLEFNAKAMGTLEDKKQYCKIEKSLIGKKGTVKFLYYTEAGIPFQPSFKCVRNEK